MKTNINQINEVHRSELYLYFYEDFIQEERTERECTFIIDKCGLSTGDKVLDLACGHGRHSICLARKGFDVSGVDLNEGFIDIAKKEATNNNLNINFIQDNILNINYKNEFDGIILLFNSFGFFDNDDVNTLLHKIKTACKTDGKIIIDIKNREHFPKELQPFYVMEKGADLMIDRLTFNPIEGTTTNKRIYIKDGIRYDAPFTMRLYNFTEFNHLIMQHGLRISEVLGHWNGSAFDSDSRRMIAVLEYT